MKNLTSTLQFLMLLVIGASALLYLSSCATSSIAIQILVPADINVPQHIQKVAVINRSLPDKEEKVKNFIEGLLTGESIYADREGSENCLLGLVNQLNSSPRFNASYLSGVDYRGTGTRSFPIPLEWQQVDELCKMAGADALVVLETFDSDNSIRKYTRVVKKTVENKQVEEIVYYADLNINVNAGWRIYDNMNKRIIDEQSFMDNKLFTGKGQSPDNALKNLPNKRSAINQAGVFAGAQFGRRISPTWVGASRKYYKGKDAELKRAKRFVQTNAWDEAIAVWEPLTENPEKKIGGRACYNMGLAFEMKGDFETALEWMKKAYYNFNMKDALPYINLLNRRIQDRQRLNEQLGD
ncbi:DUF6340 family protein [Bacteroidota bacterium]